MQTFLPIADFRASALLLDRLRLGKQIAEVGQMLQALRAGPSSPCKDCDGLCCVDNPPLCPDPHAHAGDSQHWCDACTDGSRPTPWWSHPATQAWRGYEPALAAYGQVCWTIYLERNPQTRPGAYAEQRNLFAFGNAPARMPPWLGNLDFHAGHRGHLFRKDPTTYKLFKDDSRAPLLYPVLRPDGTLAGFAERLDAPAGTRKSSTFRRWRGDGSTHPTARAAVLRGDHA